MLWSRASTVTETEIRCLDHPVARPDYTFALSVDLRASGPPNVRWGSNALNAGWLSPTGYYWTRVTWGNTSSDASGGGPCRQTTSVALAADVARTWAMDIPGTVPDGEGVAASFSLQYSTHRPWTRKPYSTSGETQTTKRPTAVLAGAVKAVNQMPLNWLQDSMRLRGQPTSHHSDELLHKADRAASQDTVLQNTPSSPCYAELIVAGSDGHFELQPPTMRTLGTVAQQAQLGHAWTHRGHTRPGSHSGGHKPVGSRGQGWPHSGATPASHSERAALRRIRRPTAMPPLQGQGRNPGAHARGMHSLTAPLATLPLGGSRSSPTPPARE